MHIKSKLLALAAGVMLVAGTGAAAVTAGGAAASTSGAPLPAYPATTTLNLGSPNCVTDDVIMNDPLDSTSPITDTAGTTGAGSPVVFSHATPPIVYYMWYLNPANVWVFDPPPGTQINPVTGVISAYNGAGLGSLTKPFPPYGIPGDILGAAPVLGSITYTVRDHGKDHNGAVGGAVGTEQFQITVDTVAGAPPVVTVAYAGNTFNNANGALTIQLNGGSTTSTALTLSAIASSLKIPGSTPVTFTLVNGSYPAWKLNGGTTGTVLTGNSASDPNIEATTANHDVVFFHLSGLSTDSGGVFYTNSDANPCVGGTPAAIAAGTGEISSFTDYSYSCLDNSNFTWADGNPLQLWKCGVAGGADQQFTLTTVGGHEVLEAVAPSGKPPGPWCVTDEGAGARLLIESCTGTGGQVISKQGPYYVFADGLVMNDAGWNANNGAWVIAYQNVGTRNERWSLP